MTYEVGDILMSSVTGHYMMITKITKTSLGKYGYAVDYLDIDFKGEYDCGWLKDITVLVQKGKR